MYTQQSCSIRTRPFPIDVFLRGELWMVNNLRTSFPVPSLYHFSTGLTSIVVWWAWFLFSSSRRLSPWNFIQFDILITWRITPKCETQREFSRSKAPAFFPLTRVQGKYLLNWLCSVGWALDQDSRAHDAKQVNIGNGRQRAPGALVRVCIWLSPSHIYWRSTFSDFRVNVGCLSLCQRILRTHINHLGGNDALCYVRMCQGSVSNRLYTFHVTNVSNVNREISCTDSAVEDYYDRQVCVTSMAAR